MGVTEIHRSGTKRTHGIAMRSENGQGLIEVLVAVIVLLIILVPASMLLMSSLRYASSDRRSIQAASIAMTEISTLSHGSFSTIASLPTCSPTLGSGAPTTTVTKESIPFSVWGCAEWRNSTGSGNLCSTTGSPGVLLVEARVTWPNIKRPPIVDATLANPPVGTISATKGFLATDVTGASNQPIPGVTVSLTSSPWLKPGGSPCTTPLPLTVAHQ
ncbi:MAG: prepilin-type N-terminal cleavage/methylation domain-containing protein, partial [Acidimicrobiales bacterium]